jgi:hypothetical protein
MDLLVPGIGEVAGGSVREERLPVLMENMRRCNVSQSKVVQVSVQLCVCVCVCVYVSRLPFDSSPLL